MPKGPKKLSTLSRRKRPKGVYAKGWATRRLRKVAREAYLATTEKPPTVNVQAVADEIARASGWNPATVAEASQMGTVHSEQHARPGDAVISLLAIHRDEQLACFMADMQCIRRMGMPVHAPIMISRSQIEAIEDFLGEQGFSMFGRRVPNESNAAEAITKTEAA
jgi:hypothetical protein